MDSISSQFKSFFVDVKIFFTNLYNNIHDFLNNYLDDTTLGIFLIAIIAIVIVVSFTQLSHK